MNQSIDQVSANPDKFTPLAKIVSVPPEYSKTVIQLRDPEDGSLLDQFEERGLKPGEVERPRAGDFRSEVTFGNVAPGDYTLRVYGTNLNNKNLKGVSFYEYVTVEENQTVMANVLMGVGVGSATFEQTYTVTDTAGNPLVGAVVTVVRNNAEGVPTYVDRYITNGQGKATVKINLVDPKGVQNAYAHTIYCYADGFDAGSTLLTDTTVNGTVVKGYAVASFGADSTRWLADSFFRWATNLEEVWGTGTYYNAAVLASVGNNYYDLVSSDTMMAIDDNVPAEDFGMLSKERNTLKNLEIEEKTFTLSAMAPQNVVAYTIPMNDETYTVSVPADTTLELHVEADGGVMTYNWYRKAHTTGANWVKMEDIEGAEAIFDTKYYTGVLIFEPVNLTDHPGYYYCEVVNDAGTAKSATIDVLVESIPLKGLAEIVGEPGIGMTLTAELDIVEKNYPDALFRYQWQKKSAGATFVDIPGATNPTYTLPVEELGSQYRVIITSGSYEGELISRAVTSCKGENNTHPTGFGIGHPETGATLPALKSTDVFKKNTKYQLEITLTAASGEKFMLHDSNTDPDYAVINGEYVDYFYPGASNRDFTKVTMYTVYDTANCITDVDLYDLLYPIGGKTADVEYQIDANGKCVAQEQSVTSIWSGVSNGKFKADYTSEYDAWLYLEAEDGYSRFYT